MSNVLRFVISFKNEDYFCEIAIPNAKAFSSHYIFQILLNEENFRLFCLKMCF